MGSLIHCQPNHRTEITKASIAFTKRLPTSNAMEKPLLDNRSYRVIKLPNQLEILLIHDPDTDKAAASMDVNVGSFSDPDDLPGTAHAVEHLCFMGNEKVRRYTHNPLKPNTSKCQL